MKETSLIVGALLVLCCSLAVTADGIDISQAVTEFRTTFLRPPFDQYILSIQFTTLDAEKEHHNDIVLSHDETWSSWCLDVTLGVNLPELPANIRDALPPTFYEFRVFYNPAPSSSEYQDPEQSQASSTEEESSSEATFCNMLAFECPDGSYASRTPDCLFVCGSQPVGGLSLDQVDAIKEEFLSAYNYAFFASVDTLYGKNAKLTPTESLSDYCIDVNLQSGDNTMYPGVYNGVRIFYYPVVCSQILCSDGTLVGCNDVCPPESASSGSIMVPVLAIIFVVVLSTCCCYLRGRRCRAKCAAQKNGFTALPTKSEDETKYPSEQYAAQLQQEMAPESPQMHAVPMMMPHMPMHPMMMMAPPHPGMMMPPHPMMPPMSPQMAAQMGYPHMPPPPMMMHPNGAYPVMMQAPNGMWFPAPPHPEDA
jgi:hypothetical protein